MSTPFDPAAYGPAVAALTTPVRVADLGPGTPNRAARDLLARFDLGRPVRDPDAARCCLAGLWLYHDSLDESHTVSQDVGTADGSFWHAIMHRREPDASNAKYWWRRVGGHPVFADLTVAAVESGYLARGMTWDPAGFVDACERYRGTNTPAEDVLKRLQLVEWQLLFDHCYRRAVGG